MSISVNFYKILLAISAEWLMEIFCNSLLLLIFMIKKCVEFNLTCFGTEKQD